MTAEQTVASSYEAWQTKHGDLSEVPLADDFPVQRACRKLQQRAPLPSSREERAATTS